LTPYATPPQFQTPSLPRTTVSKLIYTAYRISGVLENAGTGENPEELQDGFDTLNALLDGWMIERNMIYAIADYIFTLVANQEAYTIGPGGDWNFPRPPRIEVASVIYPNNTNYPVEQLIAPVTYQKWAQIPIKQTQSPIPTTYYYDQKFPLGTVHLYPVPVPQNSGMNQVKIYVWEEFPYFQNVEQQVTFPPMYLKALQYNLALELALRFPLRQKMSPDAKMLAMESLRVIKSLNAPMLEMRCDPAVVPLEGGQYNWLSDTYVTRG
jgi:hypothetical protein